MMSRKYPLAVTWNRVFPSGLAARNIAAPFWMTALACAYKIRQSGNSHSMLISTAKHPLADFLSR